MVLKQVLQCAAELPVGVLVRAGIACNACFGREESSRQAIFNSVFGYEYLNPEKKVEPGF